MTAPGSAAPPVPAHRRKALGSLSHEGVSPRWGGWSSVRPRLLSPPCSVVHPLLPNSGPFGDTRVSTSLLFTPWLPHKGLLSVLGCP